jgi:hypothetical protein
MNPNYGKRPMNDPKKVQINRPQMPQAPQRTVDSIKGHGKPLGGAPPIQPGKVAALLQDPAEVMELPPDMMEPPIQGIGSAYEVNQAVSHGADPMTLAEANAAGMGTWSANAEPQDDAEAPAEESKEEEPKETVETKLDTAERDIISDMRRSLPFDLESISVVQVKLMTPERKKAIEERLKPMDIADLIVKSEIRQDIPIIPKKLVVTLRTFTQKEYIWMLEHMYKYAGSTAYTNELLNTFKMVCTLVAVNGKLIPDHRVNGAVDEKKFKEKMEIVSRFPVSLLADFSVQASWFNDRVLDLFTYDNLKNG